MQELKFLNPDLDNDFYPPDSWLSQGCYSRHDIKDLRRDFKHSYVYDEFWFVRDYFCPYCECSSDTPGDGSFPKRTFTSTAAYSEWFCRKNSLDLSKKPGSFSDEELDLIDQLNSNCDIIKSNGSLIEHDYIPCSDGHQLCRFLGKLPETWYEKALNAVLMLLTKISGHHHYKVKKRIWTSYRPVFAAPLCALHDIWNKQLVRKLER